MLQRRQDPRHHAAGEEHAVPGAEGQDQVAGDRAEHRAEHVDGAHGARIARRRARGHVRRLQRTGILAGQFAQRAVDVDQARAADQPLVGHAPELRRQPVQDRHFLGRTRREADMAALGLQRVLVAVADHQRAHAQAGARAEDGVGAVLRIPFRRPRRPAHRHHVAGAQQRDGHGLGGEIVDQGDALEAELGAGAPARDHPGMVGDTGLVAVHATGHREHTMPDAGIGLAGRAQVVARGIGQRRVVGDREGLHRVGQQRRVGGRVGQREAGVGAADVRQQDAAARAHPRWPALPTVRGRKPAAPAGPHEPAG